MWSYWVPFTLSNTDNIIKSGYVRVAADNAAFAVTAAHAKLKLKFPQMVRTIQPQKIVRY